MNPVDALDIFVFEHRDVIYPAIMAFCAVVIAGCTYDLGRQFWRKH